MRIMAITLLRDRYIVFMREETWQVPIPLVQYVMDWIK
jgi:hypothetical protein